jgi:hypothetical protein
MLHTMSPQFELHPQSPAQLVQSSKKPQSPSPQRPHGRQSPQLMQFSPEVTSHVVLPHIAQPVRQSTGHAVQSSPASGLQKPSPHLPHIPQSAPQLRHVSAGSHVALGQFVQPVMQSLEQLVQSSPESGAHKPSPHLPHAPQSTGHEMQFSDPAVSHVPSPQPLH